MMTDFVILGVAVWRFCYMVINEDGPANVFGKWRVFIFKDGGTLKPGSIQYLHTCISCLSMVVAIPTIASWAIAPSATLLVGGAFFLSALAFAFNQLLTLVSILSSR